MPRRSDARRIALQMLYQLDLNPDAGPNQVSAQIHEELTRADLVDFAEEIVRGVQSHRSEIEQMIERVAENWRIERMAPTDRNVIRLAIFEMHHLETPAAVALNEAIELAKEFGSGNSASFVNGILDRLIPEATNGGE